MRVLVISYEFPPVISGQSIRWCHLANEMTELGADVHVLAPEFPDWHEFRYPLNPQLHIHRCPPGPFIGLAARLGGRFRARAERNRGASADGSAGPSRRRAMSTSFESTYRRLRRTLDHLLFPDVRTEWFPSAWKALRRLVPRYRYDVIVSSHEPGVTLLLGRCAQRRWKRPWIVDMGDPVAGLWVPRWRKPLDLAFERHVCRHADCVLVTCPEMIDLLIERHGHLLGEDALQSKIEVVTQGFAPRLPAMSSGRAAEPGPWPPAEEDGFTLVYTGTFYRGFRSPEHLLHAVASVGLPDFRLVLAGDPAVVMSTPGLPPSRITVLGMVGHLQCLALQRQATVLLNAANEVPHQIPGKLFEYLGAQRPILHLTWNGHDPAALLVNRLNRGVVVRNEPQAISAALSELYQAWRRGELDSRFDLSRERIEEYSWPRLAARVLGTCERLLKEGGVGGRKNAREYDDETRLLSPPVT